MANFKKLPDGQYVNLDLVVWVFVGEVGVSELKCAIEFWYAGDETAYIRYHIPDKNKAEAQAWLDDFMLLEKGV